MRSLGLYILCLFALLPPVVKAMTPEARRSFEAFERKAEEGDPAAQYRLSAILEKGYDSIPADTVRSLSLLRRSARSGYAPAQNYLGFLFQNGRILEANADSAMYYLRQAAEAGDASAMHNIAYIILENRNATPTDSASLSEGLRLLREAAESGLPQSQTLLADLYAEGRFVDSDVNEAVRLYESAISQGFSDAELRLLNLMGPRWQNLDSDAAFNEARRYWNLGAPTIAVELLHLVGPMDEATPKAYALLGHAYSRGQGAPYDHRKANEYFARAALLGNPSAQFILAETLEIFPDALKDLLPDLPASMSPQSLRESAASAGITTAEQATRALLNP